MNPRVHLVDHTWTLTYRSSDDGLIHDRPAPSWVVAVRRAVHVALKQGRAA